MVQESNVKPYTFNPAALHREKQSARQGYVTSEPYAVQKTAGSSPNVVLMEPITA